MMRRIAILAALLASPAFGQEQAIVPVPGIDFSEFKQPVIAHEFNMDWIDNPGDWTIPGQMYWPLGMPDCSKVSCVSLELTMSWASVPHCYRYEDAYVLKDGRKIPSEITETGTYGESAWIWDFKTTEAFEGKFAFHVKTVNTCPKVD